MLDPFFVSFEDKANQGLLKLTENLVNQILKFPVQRIFAQANSSEMRTT